MNRVHSFLACAFAVAAGALALSAQAQSFPATNLRLIIP